MEEKTFTAHGLEFVITTDYAALEAEPDGRALFWSREVALMNAAAYGKLPQDLSVALHAIKRILGGEVTEIRIDSTPNEG